MDKFKVGDKIRHVGLWDNWPDDSYEITEVRESFYFCGHSRSFSKIYEGYFELVKKNEMFDMKKNPWYIKVNSKEQFDAVQEWLLKNFGAKFEHGYEEGMCLSNTDFAGEQLNKVVWYANEPKGRNLLEIKFTFKTTIENVHFPVVQNEAQKKLRELEEQQRKLTDEIAKIRQSL